jgi:hypothetical protein
MAAAFADDGDELRFIVDRRRDFRHLDGVVGAVDRVAELGEPDLPLGRLLAALGDVVGVVEADGEHFLRPRHRRLQMDIAKLVMRCRAFEPAHFALDARPRLDESDHVARQAGRGEGEIDERIARHDTGARLAAGVECRELHRRAPSAWFARNQPQRRGRRKPKGKTSGAGVAALAAGGADRLRLVGGELAREIEDGAPALGRLDAGIRLEQVAGARLGQMRDLARQRARALRLVEIADQIADAAFERFGDLHEPREADAVRPMLVFLHLLERDADSARELVLAHSQFLAAQPDAGAQRDIERVWSMIVLILCHSESRKFPLLQLIIAGRNCPIALSIDADCYFNA